MREIRGMKTFIRLREFSSLQLGAAFLLWLTYNVLRIVERVQMPFEGDEFYQAHVLSSVSSWGRLMQVVRGEPGQIVPGHFFYMWPWVHLVGQDNKYLMAVPHWVVMNVFFFLFIKTDWRKLLAPALDDIKTSALVWFNLLAVFFISCNITHVYYSLEVRVYAVLSLLALLAFHLTNRIWQGPFRWRYVFYLFMVLFSHAYGVIMLAVSFLFTSAGQLMSESGNIRRRAQNVFHQAARSFLPSFFVAVLLILPFWIYLSKGSMAAAGAGRDIHLSIEPGMSGVKQVYKFFYHNKPIQHASHFFLIVGTLLFFRKRRKLLLFLATMVILPTLLIFWLDVCGRYWFLQKQFIWVVTFWSIFLALCYGETLSFARRLVKTRRCSLE